MNTFRAGSTVRRNPAVSSATLFGTAFVFNAVRKAVGVPPQAGSVVGSVRGVRGSELGTWMLFGCVPWEEKKKTPSKGPQVFYYSATLLFLS